MIDNVEWLDYAELTAASRVPRTIGCICPATSEQTCQNPICPRLHPAREVATISGARAK